MIEIIWKLKVMARQHSKYINYMIVWDLVKAIFNGILLVAIGYAILCVCEPSHLSNESILLVFGMMALSVIGKIVASYLATKYKNLAAYDISCDSRLSIGNMLRQLNMGYFDEAHLKDITSSLTTVLNDLEGTGFYIIEHLISGVLQTLIMCLGVFMFDVPTGIVAIIGIVTAYVYNHTSQKCSDTMTSKLSDAKVELDHSVIEYIRGISVVKSFGKSHRISQRVNQSIKDLHRRNFEIERTLAPIQSSYVLILRCFSVLIIVLSLYRYHIGDLSLIYTMLLTILSFSIFRSIEITGMMQNVQGIVYKAIDTVVNLNKLKPMEQKDKLEVIHSNIELKDVSFAYEQGNPVLSNINLKIPEGSTCALVGESGSGKSTLCHLMARFWDVDQGSIQIDGTDVRDYQYDALLENISIIFQDVYLFEDTIRNNICYGKPDASLEDVIAVSKKAGCHDFICQLPQGYDTVLQESGKNISGGERQRISIARAMLKDASIIIVDEATSSVDPENEHLIVSALDEISKDKTMITIAHKVNTIKNADQIVVLDQGKIVQQGKHEDLIKEEGIYRRYVTKRAIAEDWKIK